MTQMIEVGLGKPHRGIGQPQTPHTNTNSLHPIQCNGDVSLEVQ